MENQLTNPMESANKSWDMFCYALYPANFEIIPNDPPDYFRAGHSCNYIPGMKTYVFIN